MLENLHSYERQMPADALFLCLWFLHKAMARLTGHKDPVGKVPSCTAIDLSQLSVLHLYPIASKSSLRAALQ